MAKMQEILNNMDKQHRKMFTYLIHKYKRTESDKDELFQEMLIVFCKLNKERTTVTNIRDVDELNLRYVRSCLENCCKNTIAKLNVSNSILNRAKQKEYKNLLIRYENKEPMTKEEILTLAEYSKLNYVECKPNNELHASFSYKLDFGFEFILNLIDNDYDKSIIRMSFINKLTDGEIGEALGKSRTTIRDRKKKIFRELREKLLDLGIDEDVLLTR